MNRSLLTSVHIGQHVTRWVESRVPQRQEAVVRKPALRPFPAISPRQRHQSPAGSQIQNFGKLATLKRCPNARTGPESESPAQSAGREFSRGITNGRPFSFSWERWRTVRSWGPRRNTSSSRWMRQVSSNQCSYGRSSWRPPRSRRARKGSDRRLLLHRGGPNAASGSGWRQRTGLRCPRAGARGDATADRGPCAT
jgi:hypothetical protein